MKDIQLTVTNITEENRKEKYIAASQALAKAMKLPITLHRRIDETHAEGFPYQAYMELVRKWNLFYAALLDSIYMTTCAAFDLPVISTFSKAVDDVEPLIYKGQILYSPETGKPISRRQWRQFVLAIERFLNWELPKAEKGIVLESSALGRILERMLKYNTWEAIEKMRLDEIKYKRHSFDWLSDKWNMERTFGMDNFQAARLQVANDTAAQYIRSMAEKSKSAVSQALLNGIKERKPKTKIAQELFDTMGSLNRDWERIVETEMGDNINTAFLLAQKSEADPGEKVYFQRYEIKDTAICKHCDKIRGLIALWSDVALDDEKINDPYAKVAIWEGKTRVGRKASDDWVAAGTQHPWCYSDDTEVLTNAGWMLIKDLSGGEKIMSINPDTREVGYARYINKIAYHYKGDMIHFNGLNYDMLVTPNHNMLFSTPKLWKQKLLKAESAQEVIKRCTYYLPMAIGEWKGAEPPKTIEIAGVKVSYRDYVRLWAWFLSEGSTRRHQVALAQKIPDKIVNDLPSMQSFLRKAKSAVYLYGEASDHFSAYIGVHAEQKYIPTFIKSLSPEYIREFLDAFSLGDGSRDGQHHAKSYPGDSHQVIVRTSSPRMMADLCELVVKAGWMPSVWEDKQKRMVTSFSNGDYILKTNCFNINIKKSKFRHYFGRPRPSKNGGASHAPQTMPYDGMVYDVELEKWHFLLVKRNGKVGWSGNCRGSWSRWYPPTEKTTSMYDAAMAKLEGRQRAWGEAVAQARQEYFKKGIKNPDDTTPGYLERINEIYHAAT
jgi:hypothetical protein